RLLPVASLESVCMRAGNEFKTKLYHGLHSISEMIKTFINQLFFIQPSTVWCLTDFLAIEYSEENLLLWMVCEDYKKVTSERQMKVWLLEEISQQGPNCFVRAQRLIYGRMENDSYLRFLKSKIYYAVLEQAEQAHCTVLGMVL
uniref:Regulator of G-protein signaling 1 n=1 Tax=Monopterus albus TaxID=43700 RepID=A0A3Q3RD28_MONAL